MIDTVDWSTRTIDSRASLVATVGSLLVTLRDGTLIGYQPAGAIRWRLRPASPPLGIVWTHAPYLYVPREDNRMAVVDARSGHAVATADGSLSLFSPATPLW